MRKNIIQSKTEPNKNDIWLSEEGLKKYGKNGWEPLGGGNSSNSGGSGSVIIEYPEGSNEKITVTDEQINAVKNANVKIKLTIPGTTNYIILVPISIEITEEVAGIIVRSALGVDINDVMLLVDFTNKTISIPEQ